MSEGGQSDVDALTGRGPACDNCKARKVRCDRNSPCFHCRTSSLPCRTTKKVLDRRQRISVSGRYDKEIESVNGRLASLERMLETVLASNRTESSSSNASSSASSAPTLSTPRDQLAWRELDFEGDSSFRAQVRSVTQVMEKGLKSGSDVDAETIGGVTAAVATLRNFLNEKPGSPDTAAPLQDTLQDVVDYPELSLLTLPSMQTVLSLLRYAKTHALKYLHDVPNLSLERLTTLCQKIYFPTEEFTIATFITVHVCLLNLFRELTQVEIQDLNLSVGEREAIFGVCLKNAETAVRNLRLYMPPTFDNIEALMLGATLGMDSSQTALAWTLINAALRMAQDAGYHRLPPYSVAPEVTPKRLLFWFLYCLERSMALNLGRASSVADYDIQTDRPKYPEELGDTVWGALFSSWFDFSKLQGDIYDQLYSARAQKEAVEVKVDLARKLAIRLKTVQTGFMVGEIQMGKEYFQDSIREGLLSILIVQYSVLCLVYRMIPPTPVNNEPIHPLKSCDEAIQAARQALHTNNEAWALLYHKSKEEWRLFAHYSLLWCPFIPYIVLIGNVIADGNVDDFKLIEKCVDTLHTASQVSVSVSKLYRACRIFYQIAKLYLSQRDKDPQSPAVQKALPNPSTTVPSDDAQQVPFDPDVELPDFPLSHADWNGMLDEWDLGLGAGNAREMSFFFEPYLTSGSGGATTRGDYILPGNLHSGGGENDAV